MKLTLKIEGAPRGKDFEVSAECEGRVSPAVIADLARVVEAELVLRGVVADLLTEVMAAEGLERAPDGSIQLRMA